MITCGRGPARRRVAARPARVPESVIDRLIGKWDAPDLTETHAVHWVEWDRFA